MLIRSIGTNLAARFRRPSPALIVATIALALSVTGNAAAAIIITSNSQVASGTIAGHQPPAGKHANLISGSVNATDLASTLRASLTVHCPAGLQKAADLCFESVTRPEKTFLTALQTCQAAGRRLPSVAELV